jgi:predicted transcriptional regulator
MACVNPDGSISESGRALLKAAESPAAPEEIGKKIGQPLFKIRSSLRELHDAGLIVEKEGKYSVTDAGKKML